MPLILLIYDRFAVCYLFIIKWSFPDSDLGTPVGLRLGFSTGGCLGRGVTVSCVTLSALCFALDSINLFRSASFILYILPILIADNFFALISLSTVNGCTCKDAATCSDVKKLSVIIKFYYILLNYSKFYLTLLNFGQLYYLKEQYFANSLYRN